ncbi:MAG: DUF3276 family protein [Alistipes sp.]
MQTHTTTTQRDDTEHADRLILAKTVKAGRRTYFLDVHATRGGDYFLTITESRKKTGDDGSVTFDRHKIFLYKEDFDKFIEGLRETVDFIRQSRPNVSTAKAPTKSDTER